MTYVRKIEEKDLEWLYEECKTFSKYYKTKSLLGEKEYVLNLVRNLSRDHIVIVAEDSNLGLMGCLAAILTPHLFNPEIKTLTIIFWWVAEKHRNSRAGYMLLKEFTRIGKEKADWTIFSIGLNTPIKNSTIEKLGFISHEKTYLKETGGT